MERKIDAFVWRILGARMDSLRVVARGGADGVTAEFVAQETAVTVELATSRLRGCEMAHEVTPVGDRWVVSEYGWQVLAAADSDAECPF